MAVHKLTPRYLNKDDDERLIKSTEMTDAINVRISTDENGDSLVLKNAYGNTAVDLDSSLPAGTNKVIGSVSDEQLGFIFYFVWNSNEDHSIYRYSVGANQAQRVIKDSVLEFTENGFVKGNIYVNINDDVLLYFNDSLTAPKKINTTKALINGYPQFLTGTDEEKLLVLTAAKQPPLSPPSYSFVNNSSLKENRIKEKNFQFAYKYIYEDGEHSAMSPYSSLTVSTPQLKDSFSNQGQLNFFNQINIFVKNSPADVDKIAVYAREGNEGAFYLIKELSNNVGTTSSTVNFTNESIGTALPLNEQNKLYDNVPQVADSQEIVSGRLMYGGYSEGYPNVNVSNADVLPNYYDDEKIYNVTTSFDSNGQVEFDWSELPDSFDTNSVLYVNMTFRAEEILLQSSGDSDLDLQNTYSITSTDGDGGASKVSQIEKARDGLKFLMGGINVKKKIDIPSGTTRNGVISLFKSSTQGNREECLLSPLPGGKSITNLTTGGTSLFTVESGDFKGRAIVELFWNGTATLNFRFIYVDLAINSFFFGGNKREIIGAAEEARIRWNWTLSGSADITTAYTNENLLIGSFFASRSFYGERAFKSGSSHKLGIVYYDDRNRSSGVQELTSLYVDDLSSRGSRVNLDNGNTASYGRASAVIRLKNQPPSWAKKWSPVYTGKGNTELKLFYGIQGAYIPFRDDASLSSFSSSKNIYLSLKHLFDSDSSYVRGDGADISYTFEKGDKLRIIDYSNGSKESQEFEVVDFVTLSDDDNNPILNKGSESSIKSTTGSFIVIKENIDAVPFRRSRIIKNTSGWFDKCIVEIVRSKQQVGTDVYYELGFSYDITNNIHEDERVSTSVPVAIESGSTASDVQFTTAVKVFKGDVIVNGDYVITVGNVTEYDNQYYVYATANVTPINGTYTVSNPDTVIELEHGDVYWKLRTLYVETDQPTSWQSQSWVRQNAVIRYVEDYSVSDFFNSNSTSIGRPIAYIPDAKTVKRKGSITYSDFDAEDSLRLNLSSFNLSLANFKDTSYEYGSIKYLVGYNDVLYSLQEKRVARLPVSRNIVQTGTGDNLVTIDSNVLGQEQYYVGEYGVGRHPESVAFKDGMTYFCDVNAGKVIRIDSQGVTIISDVNMSSYFESKFNDVSRFPSHLVGGGIDSDNDHYLVHSGEVTTSQVLIDDGDYSYDVSLDSTGTQVSAQTQYNPSAVFGFSTDPRTLDSTCDFFDSGAEAVVYLDQLSSGAPVYVNIPYQASNVLGVATNSNFDFFVTIRVNMYLPGFFFDNGFCTSDNSGSIDPNSSAIESFTAAYSMGDRVWTTLYSFVPERVDSVHSLMYTFRNGRIYKHDETSDRNRWYGGAVEATTVEVVSNTSPSAIKTFESISLEGNSKWDTTVSTTNQSASISESSLKSKEGFYYGYVHGSTSSYGSTITSLSSTSELFTLGEVSDNVSGSSVTFTNKLASFPIGTTATLYSVNGTTLVSKAVNPTSVNGSTVTFSGNVTASAGDLLVVIGDSSIEGDQIRDYYMKVRISKATTSPIELFAINTIVTDSKAHN